MSTQWPPTVHRSGSPVTRVRNLMTTEVVYVMPDAPVRRIARLMQDKAISGIPVIDDEWRVVGMVTDLDLIVRNTRLEPPLSSRSSTGAFPSRPRATTRSASSTCWGRKLGTS